MNIQLIAEQIGHIHLTLETQDAFEVYGGTALAPFEVSQTGTAQWTLTVREQVVAAAPLRQYNVYARHLATGREWEVLSGKVLVSPRTAAVPSDKLAPVEYHVSVPIVDSVLDTQGMAIVTGIPGPQGPQGEKGNTGASAFQLAAQHGYTGTEAEWVAELQGAQAAANAAKDSAATATTAAAAATEASAAAAKSAAAGDTQQNLAAAALGDTPMELLPTSYAEWSAENSAVLNASEKNTLTILLKAAEAAALTMPVGFKKLVVCNTGNVSVVKKAIAEKSLYIYERSSTVQSWNIAEIKAPVVTFVYPELVNAKDSFYSINASRLNLVFPKLRSVGSFFMKHNIIGVQEVRFYMPNLAGSCSMFPSNALTAASLLNLAKTLPTVASAQVITIGAAAALESDAAFQTSLATALAGKNWTFSLNYI